MRLDNLPISLSFSLPFPFPLPLSSPPIQGILTPQLMVSGNRI